MSDERAEYDRDPTRRRFLAALGGTATVTTAGCQRDAATEDTPTSSTSTTTASDATTEAAEQPDPPGVGEYLFDSPPLTAFLADGEAWVWPSTIQGSVGYTTRSWYESPPTREDATDVQIHAYEPDGWLVPVGIGGMEYAGELTVGDLHFSVSVPGDGEARLLREQVPDARVAYDDVGRTFTLPEDGELTYGPPSGVVVEVPREAWVLSYGVTAASEDVLGVGRELSLPAFREQMDEDTDGGADDGD